MIALIILSVLFTLLTICFARIKNIKKSVIKRIRSDKYHSLMEKLYGKERAYVKEEEYLFGKVLLCMIIITGGIFMATMIAVTEYVNPVFDSDNRIERDGYEGIDKTVSLWVDRADKERESITINVSHRVYKREELDNMSEDIINNVEKYILGNNISVENATYDLSLINHIDGYPFDISWRCDKPLILGRDGVIDYERLEEALNDDNDTGIRVILNMVMSYEEYRKEAQIPICLKMPTKSEDQVFSEMLNTAIVIEDEASLENEYMKLPEYIDGVRIVYSEKKGTTYILLLILVIIAAVTVSSAKDNELNKMLKKKYEDMERDYPKIVNQYALYYCAGMHTKSIWHEICHNYCEELKKGGKSRDAFEEMLIQDKRMIDGVGEMRAYNDFSEAVKLRSYRGFISIIEQALVKGKDNVVPILNKEADNAQKERMNRARILGEKAGTKMLVPMFMMLGVVLLIIIVPAFVSFQI